MRTNVESFLQYGSNCTIFQWTLTSILTCISGAIDDTKANKIPVRFAKSLSLLVLCNILHYIEATASHTSWSSNYHSFYFLLNTSDTYKKRINLWIKNYDTIQHFFIPGSFMFFFFCALYFDAINKKSSWIINKWN